MLGLESGVIPCGVLHAFALNEVLGAGESHIHRTPPTASPTSMLLRLSSEPCVLVADAPGSSFNVDRQHIGHTMRVMFMQS